jgi:plasmid rolling circle replication initiator protein Rep
MQVNNNILSYIGQQELTQADRLTSTENPVKIEVAAISKNDIAAALVEQDRQAVKAEIDKKYDPKKRRSLLLAASYDRIGKEQERRSYLAKSERVRDCATFLQFTGQHLTNANFCKDRLCPMCAWRKSEKIFGEMSAVMDKVETDSRFIFLTLTVKNVPGNELSNLIDDLFVGYKKLMQRKEIKNAVKGWFRALEITYSQETGYHPHFHVVLQVHKNYFGKNYIKQTEYVRLWREVMKLDYDPQVDIRKVSDIETGNAEIGNAQIGKAVAETAKYTVKDNDYIYPSDEKKTDEIVEVLDMALKGRRLIAYGGELKKLHKAVLIEQEKEKEQQESDMRDDVEQIVTTYHWNVGFGYRPRQRLI